MLDQDWPTIIFEFCLIASEKTGFLVKIENDILMTIRVNGYSICGFVINDEWYFPKL